MLIFNGNSNIHIVAIIRLDRLQNLSIICKKKTGLLHSICLFSLWFSIYVHFWQKLSFLYIDT